MLISSVFIDMYLYNVPKLFVYICSVCLVVCIEFVLTLYLRSFAGISCGRVAAVFLPYPKFLVCNHFLEPQYQSLLRPYTSFLWQTSQNCFQFFIYSVILGSFKKTTTTLLQLIYMYYIRMYFTTFSITLMALGRTVHKMLLL